MDRPAPGRIGTIGVIMFEAPVAVGIVIIKDPAGASAWLLRKGLRKEIMAGFEVLVQQSDLLWTVSPLQGLEEDEAEGHVMLLDSFEVLTCRI